MKTKLPLSTAITLAESIVTALAPGCSRIAIAGSVRREKPEVGDIEIVCIPRVTGHDLFGVPQYSLNMLNTLIDFQGWETIKAGDHYRQYDVGPCALDQFITTLGCKVEHLPKLTLREGAPLAEDQTIALLAKK